MKTRNAFAFRNFDEQRILSRPYFRQFRADCHVEDGLSDEEILQSLDAADDDSLDVLEQKLQTLRKAHTQLDYFYKFIWRHIEKRLSPYDKRKAEKYGVKVAELRDFCRPAPIPDYVMVVGFGIRDFMKKVFDFYHELEAKTEKRYRAEFATRLKRLRQNSGLSQRRLSDIVQISPQGFSMYESGKREPSITTMFRLAKVLPIAELFA